MRSPFLCVRRVSEWHFYADVQTNPMRSSPVCFQMSVSHPHLGHYLFWSDQVMFVCGEKHICASTRTQGLKSKAGKIPEVACGNKTESSWQCLWAVTHPGLVTSDVTVCSKVLSPDVHPALAIAPTAQSWGWKAATSFTLDLQTFCWSL